MRIFILKLLETNALHYFDCATTARKSLEQSFPGVFQYGENYILRDGKVIAHGYYEQVITNPVDISESMR